MSFKLLPYFLDSVNASLRDLDINMMIVANGGRHKMGINTHEI